MELDKKWVWHYAKDDLKQVIEEVRPFYKNDASYKAFYAFTEAQNADRLRLIKQAVLLLHTGRDKDLDSMQHDDKDIQILMARRCEMVEAEAIFADKEVQRKDVAFLKFPKKK